MIHICTKFIKKLLSQFDMEQLGLHRALTPPPSSRFGMNWNADRESGLIIQCSCGWMRAWPCSQVPKSSGKPEITFLEYGLQIACMGVLMQLFQTIHSSFSVWEFSHVEAPESPPESVFLTVCRRLCVLQHTDTQSQWGAWIQFALWEH